MLLFNFSEYTWWNPYSPPDSFGTQKVTFDGINKLILINENETTIDFRTDVYSMWKEWVTWRDYAKYEFAITAIGGQPITGTQNVGITYFLENGWRIQPWSGNYVLEISGNLYTREVGQNPVVPTSGVAVSLTRSNLVDVVAPEVSLSESDIGAIAANTSTQVWADIPMQDIVANTADGVWSQSVVSYNDPTTFGGWTKKKLATTTKVIAFSE
jgi:hypothetical protein